MFSLEFWTLDDEIGNIIYMHIVQEIVFWHMLNSQ